MSAISQPAFVSVRDELTAAVGVTRWRHGEPLADSDAVAREEPLELRLNGRAVAVLMRTPGSDEELGLGFLLTERVIADAAEVAELRHCTVAGHSIAVAAPDTDLVGSDSIASDSVAPDSVALDSVDNVLLIRLREGAVVDWDRLRRNVYASASCGVCGKASIASVRASVPPSSADGARPTLSAATLLSLPSRLRAAQLGFAESGGLHAAAMFDAAGEVLAVREDVGRHNAVDKMIGWSLRVGHSSDFRRECGLMLSGRVSFEMVQKAAAAGLSAVVAVSAPTSLAVQLAEELGLALVGFLREARFNVYAGAERISP